MFTRVAAAFTFLFLVLPILATASTVPRTDTPPAGQCNTGTLQCCKSLQSADATPVTLLADLLGIVIEPITGQVGLTCSPLSIIGVGGNSCTAQPACCTGNSFHGVLVLGCTPINANL
ncbi:hydrophobin-319 [Macrolepiota fuliginosa MF-IS2]|uniref:Hydrophobin n=1 Tax=Macrolepiota fuliginosa MF-IS2 TaxID=1400762 RepID=A0A9P5X1G5_9AGAR|nr:hydrophobin-319 [Macrolepiota fuliginosa MF-IS2]